MAFWAGELSVMGLLQWRGFDDDVVSYARVRADKGVGADYGGPLIVVWLWMTVPSPFTMLFVIVACSTIVP